MHVMADISSSQLTAMATQVQLVGCVAVIAFLLQTALSEHTKKIIVKVPHLIKHIHHDHYKPVHVHKVHAKKVEHHSDDKDEEELGGWKHGHKEVGGKHEHKAHGSFSHLKPVLVNQHVEEHMEYPRGQGKDYGHGHEYGHEHEYGGHGHEHTQEDGWKSESNSEKQRTKNNDDDSYEEHSSWTPDNLASWMHGGEYRGDEWPMSSEDSSDLRGENGFSSGRGYSDNRNKKSKSKQSNWRTKHIGQEPHGDTYRGDEWLTSSSEDLSDLRGEDGFSSGRGFSDNGNKKEKSEQLNWRSKHTGQEPHGGEYRGGEWLMSSEDLSDLRGEDGFSSGRGFSDNGNKKSKSKKLNWSTKHNGQEPHDDGWKPIMDFSGWKDVGHSFGGHDDNQFIHSEEDKSESSSEYEDIHHERVPSDSSHKKNKKQKKNKKNNGNKTTWSKQIEVREPSAEESQLPPQQSIQQQPIQQQPYTYQVERPVPIVANIPLQFHQDLHMRPQPVQLQQLPSPMPPPQPQPQPTSWPLLPQQPQTQHTSWPLPHQQPQQVQNRWPSISQPQLQHQQQQQPQQFPAQQPQQPSAMVWNRQPAPTTQPTQPAQAPKVIWSGHHLQLPKHSMWHVQQHSVQAVPVQVIPVNHNPQPVQPVHQPPVLPWLPQQQSSQLQQASVPLHKVVTPEWPVTQRTQQPQIKQQWEQSVQTSGINGPSSSYKVEVINYTAQKDRPK